MLPKKENSNGLDEIIMDGRRSPVRIAVPNPLIKQIVKFDFEIIELLAEGVFLSFFKHFAMTGSVTIKTVRSNNDAFFIIAPLLNKKNMVKNDRITLTIT